MKPKWFYEGYVVYRDKERILNNFKKMYKFWK